MQTVKAYCNNCLVWATLLGTGNTIRKSSNTAVWLWSITVVRPHCSPVLPSSLSILLQWRVTSLPHIYKDDFGGFLVAIMLWDWNQNFFSRNVFPYTSISVLVYLKIFVAYSIVTQCMLHHTLKTIKAIVIKIIIIVIIIVIHSIVLLIIISSHFRLFDHLRVKCTLAKASWYTVAHPALIILGTWVRGL